MSIPFIDLKTQYQELKPQIQERINRVLEHGQYIMGPEVVELETRLAEYTGAKYCITVASGTEALLISLMALDIGPGDEVITSPFTFAATAEVIVLLGAKPVFVDIEPDTCNIDTALIEEKITSKTKAIMPVSLYGQPADMDVINEIARKYGNIPVIEDAAQSFGSTYKDRKSCNLSTFGCTSFFPSKPLGCYGDGGAIFTSSDKLAEATRVIRVHGQTERYCHARIGVGGRMDTLQCAVVLAKMEQFDTELYQKRLKIELYGKHLKFNSKVRPTTIRDHTTSSWGQFTLLVENRSKLQEYLTSQDIPTAIHYPTPLPMQPAYREFCCPDCVPIARYAAERVLSLPISATIKNIHIEHIATSVNYFYTRCETT